MEAFRSELLQGSSSLQPYGGGKFWKHKKKFSFSPCTKTSIGLKAKLHLEMIMENACCMKDEIR